MIICFFLDITCCPTLSHLRICLLTTYPGKRKLISLARVEPGHAAPVEAIPDQAVDEDVVVAAPEDLEVHVDLVVQGVKLAVTVGT